jgi:hypothetical protein
MKHNLKTFPHKEDFDKEFITAKSASEWVDSNIRCPEYHEWLKGFVGEFRQLDLMAWLDKNHRDGDKWPARGADLVATLAKFRREVLGEGEEEP